MTFVAANPQSPLGGGLARTRLPRTTKDIAGWFGGVCQLFGSYRAHYETTVIGRLIRSSTPALGAAEEGDRQVRDREVATITYRHMKGAAGAPKRGFLGRAVGGTLARYRSPWAAAPTGGIRRSRSGPHWPRLRRSGRRFGWDGGCARDAERQGMACQNC